MKRKYFYTKNQKVGDYGILFIEELSPKIYLTKRTRQLQRMACFQCFCGNKFKTTIEHVRGNHTTSCGCKREENLPASTRTHGKTSHRLYPVWFEIKDRCFNPNNKAYKRYGGRGITVFPIWVVDFQSFYEYVTALPEYNKKGYSLDRINNDGNYEPGNLRWATSHTQAANSRKGSKNTSGYKGIYGLRGKWMARISAFGREIYLGCFKTKEDAVAKRNDFIVENNLYEYKIQPIISE